MPIKRIASRHAVKPKVENEKILGELPITERPLLEKAEVGIEPKTPYSSLMVDERVIPDANLPTEYVEGVLDIAQEGSGLLRPHFAASDKDIYISASQIRRFNLRVGDMIGGQARRPKENERYWGLLKVEKINDEKPESLGERPNLDDLTAIYPDAKITLSTAKEPLSTRVIDLVSPIGFGQRGLIVSPPKAGKTWLLKDIIAGIAVNYPEGPSKLKTNSKPKAHLMA